MSNQNRDRNGRFAGGPQKTVLNKGQKAKRVIERKKRKKALSGNRLSPKGKATTRGVKLGKRVITKTERNTLERSKRKKRRG